MRRGYIPSTAVTAILLAFAGAGRGSDTLAGRVLMSEINSGEVAPAALAARWLRAGPIWVKLQDGQLRYLRVGDKEIVRRIYFGVRDGKWVTVMPYFTQMQVESAEDHFTVHLAAECKSGQVGYGWKGVITGTAEGKITFQAEGAANADFDSNRIGLCVLFGTPSLAGQQFETDGRIPSAEFPRLIAPGLVAAQFHQLHYTTADGLAVSASLEGAIFDMEDQRNWGDSSWKAYAPLPYAYKHLVRGETKSQTVTIAVSGKMTAEFSPQTPVKLKIGEAVAGAAIPVLIASAPATKTPAFPDISFARGKFKDLAKVEWSYTSTTHLPDDDTIMENLPAVADQARTVRSFNPKAELFVGPIHLPPDRMNTPIAAAWAVGLVKALALGGVKQASFDLGADLPATAINAVAPYANCQLLDVELSPADAHRVLAFAVENKTETILFLVNKTKDTFHVKVTGVKGREAKVFWVGSGKHNSGQIEPGEALIPELAPFDICRVTIGK